METGSYGEGLDINFNTAHRATPVAAHEDEGAVRVVQDHNRSSRIVKDWYTRHASSLWGATNVVAGSTGAAIGWDHAPRAVLIAWLLFTSLNAALYIAISHQFSPWFQNRDRDSNATQIGMAFAFGAAWGACFLFIGRFLPPNSAYMLISLCLFVSLTALPVFAIHRGAYPVFAILIAVFAVAGLSGNPDLDYIEIVVGLIFAGMLILAQIYAKFIRTVVTALTNFTSTAGNDAVGKRGAIDLPKLFERQVRTLNRLARDQRRATAALDAIGDAIVTTNEAGLIDYMNPVAEVLTGVPFNEANGQRIEEVVNITSHGGANLVGDLVEACRSTARVRNTGEHSVLKRRDGVEYEIEYQISTIRDNAGETAGTSCLLRDVTTKHDLIRRVAWRSTHDPLTNLINRTEFENRINNLFAANSNDGEKRHALCFVDFDQFKFINETHGVEGGDHVLKSIAAELKQKIRGADTLARIGEDKFGILLYSCPIDKARLIAEGLRRLVEDYQAEWNGAEMAVSVSIGAIEIDPAADDLTGVLSGAEAACECAKKDGGNRVHVFRVSEPLERRRSDSTKRLREIQSAIQSNRFELYYQQICPIRRTDHQARMCQLQLRMQDATGELLSPRDFLVSAKRYQLMPEIDRWAAKAAIDALRVNHPILREMDTICINISGQSINDDRFLDFVVDLLDDEVDNNRICFDISEAGLISNLERARFFVATLKELDCRIAVDDSGLAMRSLELLKRLQVDYLKIGVGFIRNMAHNSVDYEIVLALSRIAKTLRIETIAEGVATLAMKDSLLPMGIDYVQGLLIGRPHPVSPGKIATH